MDKRNYNRIVRNLYAVIEQSGLTSRKFHDPGWAGVNSVIETVNKALEPLSIQYGEYFTYSIEYVPGYSADMMTKTYNMQICNMANEKILGGEIRGYAAGTVQDPWLSYDLTCSFWTL